MPIVAHVNTGAGGSGKSTVFKQMKVIYGDQYSELERRQHLPIIYGYAKKSENYFDLCTHMLNDEHRINMTITPPCSWHCITLHYTPPQQRLELHEDPGRPGREDGSRWPSRVQGTIQYGPRIISRCDLLHSIPFPAPHALPLLSSASVEHSVCYLTPSHNIHESSP